jgi:putative transposase
MSKDFDVIALFWGGVLSPVLFKPPDDHRSNRQILISLTKEHYMHPDGMMRTYSLSTLKRKLNKYQKKGIKGFLPAPRSDEGSIRGNRESALERAIELKRVNPWRSCFMLNLMLRSEGFDPIPESTLQRHLSLRGITVRKLGYEGTIIRKRWSREHTHSLWVGDFSQGPNVIDENGVSHKTWISAFIDVHSRFLVTGIYALSCDMDALVRSLLAAFELHGKPRALYLDNAKVYRSPILARACLELEIELIHRTAYDPQGGGIIERFFLTLQSQLERELQSKGVTDAPLDLKRLNDLFEIWCEEIYHKRRHSETGQSPVQRYRDGLLHDVVPLLSEEASSAFYHEIKRTVNKDFCDITIGKRRYRSPVELRGDRVLVRYPLGNLGDTVELRDLKGQRVLGKGVLNDRKDRYVPDPPPLIEEDVNFSDLLIKLRQESKSSETSGLPQKPIQDHWDLGTFLSKLNEVTGTPIDTLTEKDLQLVAKILQRNPAMSMKKLREVFRGTANNNLYSILNELSKEML